MSLVFATTAGTAQTIFGTATQFTGGVEGLKWNKTTSTWTSQSFAGGVPADYQITMTEGAGGTLQSYTGGIATALGTFTGQVLQRVHDGGAADRTIGAEVIYMSLGVEVTTGTTAAATISAALVSTDRTWFVTDSGEYATAPEVVNVAKDSTLTVAMDLTYLLNPGTDITGTPTAVVDTVQTGVAPGLASVALDQTRKQVHVTATASTIGKYKLKFTATSTDSQQLVGYGWLHVD